MAYPITKNQTAVTNALTRDGFVCRSQTASWIKFDPAGRPIKIATIETRRDGRHFAVVKLLGFART